MKKSGHYTLFLTAFLICTFVAGCSETSQSNSKSVDSTSNSAQASMGSGKSPSSLLQTSNVCSATELRDGSAWIKGQLRAFNESEPKVAYEYASEQFRAKTSLEQFVYVIRSQYSMLLDLKSYSVINCERNNGYFLYQVKVIDNSNQSYDLQYLLSYTKKKWGVEAAVVSS
jgi:hypothetical protein